MRKYQESLYDAITSKRNYYGSNMVVETKNYITKIGFYGSLIGVVNHVTKTYKCDNCGFTNACTTARINTIKLACEELGYKEE